MFVRLCVLKKKPFPVYNPNDKASLIYLLACIPIVCKGHITIDLVSLLYWFQKSLLSMLLYNNCILLEVVVA